MKGDITIEKYEKLQAEFVLFQKESAEQIADLKFQLENLKRMIFGAKSERYISNNNPEQFSLFNPPSDEKKEAEVLEVPAHERKKGKRKEKPVRLALPEHLERKETILEPNIDLTDMVTIGEQRTEMLAYTPATLTVEVIVRPKYAPKQTKQQADTSIQIAELPSRFIAKCVAHESLLAAILVDKYVDHLPLYRTAGRFQRQGVRIPRSTLSGWVSQSAAKMQILYQALMKMVLESNYLQVDETRMEVQLKKTTKKKNGPPKKGKTHRGFLWGYNAVHEKLLFFEYDPTREATNPAKRLQGFTGTIQTDCYDVYDQIRNAYPNLTHYHCLNHARREFEKALTNDAKRASHAMDKFQLLYAIERRAAQENWTTEKIKQVRFEKAKPVLDELYTWMEIESLKVLPKSPIGKAMGYMLKRKQRMTHYLTQGHLLIDTNPIENAIRPIAVGRKNYLFAGSHQAAQNAAIFYSFFACCKLNDVNPYEWLFDVMKKMPDSPVNQIHQLLPHNWKKQQIH